MNLYIILGGLIAALLAFIAGESIGDSEGYARGTAEKQLVINMMIIDHQNELIVKNGLISELSKTLQEHKDEADAERVALHDKNRIIAAELHRVRTERNGLRESLDAALATAVGQSGGPEAALQACSEHGKRLNGQLDLGVQLLAKLAGRAEGCSVDLRGVLAAWPVAEEVKRTD